MRYVKIVGNFVTVAAACLFITNEAASQSTCGPNPIPLSMQAQQQAVTQQRMIQKQLDLLQAQNDYQHKIQDIQYQMRINQLQNASNPQLAQMTNQRLIQQLQSLQKQYQERVLEIQRMP